MRMQWNLSRSGFYLPKQTFRVVVFLEELVDENILPQNAIRFESLILSYLLRRKWIYILHFCRFLLISQYFNISIK